MSVCVCDQFWIVDAGCAKYGLIMLMGYIHAIVSTDYDHFRYVLYMFSFLYI